MSEIYSKLKNRLYSNFSDTTRMGFEKVELTKLGRINPFEVTVLWNLDRNIQDVGIVSENIGAEAFLIPEYINHILNSVTLKQKREELRSAGFDFDSDEIVFSKVVYLYTNNFSISELNVKQYFKDKGLRLKIRCFDNIHEEKRIAVLFGNGEYEHLVKLNNPLNDIDRLNKSLNNLGFESFIIKDSTKENFDKVKSEIQRKIAGYNEILFFYAGHGYYMEGTHYLIPTDGDIKSHSDLEEQGIRFDEVLELTESTDHNPTRIFILDSCRVPSMPDYSDVAMERIEIPNSFIAYATSIGSKAKDGNYQNGRFTSAILNNIEKPDITINEIFEMVNKEVSQSTNNEQVPWFQSSLTKEYMFNELVKIT
ncbi:MAG: hypothetical protein ACJAUV_001666 [Flavobacteriales bacterium]|jgi:hypothetical protein